MKDKILLIDDAPDAIMLAAKHLSDFGDVLAATSGAQGLEIARKFLPEIILLDVQMPGVDGFEVLAELKAYSRTSGIPVIMVTSDNRPESESGLLDCGAADFIAKPINPAVLKARVVKELRLLKQKRLIEESHQFLEEKVVERTSQLRLAKEAAEAAVRAKSNFLGNMSHEMRTPLHQMKSFLYLVQRLAHDDKTRSLLEKMASVAERLSNMIEGILTVTDLESKSLAVEPGPLDIAGMVAEVLALQTEKADKKGLHLASTGQAPSALLGDRRLLAMALNCYASNALTYTEKGAVELRTEVVEESAEDCLLKFSVADTGPGIPPDVQSRLFTLFEQADNTSTRRFGGTGLGLYLVKGIANALGGDAGCDSTAGRGSTFWLTVRCRKDLPAGGPPPFTHNART